MTRPRDPGGAGSGAVDSTIPLPGGRSALAVSAVTFLSAAPHDIARGLLGFVSFRLGDSIELRGVAVRRSRDGTVSLSLPIREDRHGRRHSIVRLLNTAAHGSIEDQVIAVLRARGAVR